MYHEEIEAGLYYLDQWFKEYGGILTQDALSQLQMAISKVAGGVTEKLMDSVVAEMIKARNKRPIIIPLKCRNCGFEQPWEETANENT